jgi:ParB family chromosome partitioning protein
LLENVTRLHPGSLELMREIGALKNRDYTNTDIAARCNAGEYRHGNCPHPDHDVQQLAKPYENKLLHENKLLPGTKPGIRWIILQRSQRRKSPSADPARRPQHREITATALTQGYKTEAQRQKLSIKMADLAQTRLTFIVDAPLAVLRVGHRTLSRRSDDGSTAVVDFRTSRDVREVARSHLNFAVADTSSGSSRRPT